MSDLTVPTVGINLDKDGTYWTRVWRVQSTQQLMATIDVAQGAYISFPSGRHGEEAIHAIDDLLAALGKLRGQVKKAQDAPCGECGVPLIFGRHLPCDKTAARFCGSRDCHPFAEKAAEVAS